MRFVFEIHPSTSSSLSPLLLLFAAVLAVLPLQCVPRARAVLPAAYMQPRAAAELCVAGSPAEPAEPRAAAASSAMLIVDNY